jgi:hypothetical protein
VRALFPIAKVVCGNVSVKDGSDISAEILCSSALGLLIRALSNVSLPALAGVLFAASAGASVPGSISFSALDANSNEVIGSQTYSVQQLNGKVILLGHAKYGDGQSDFERDDLQVTTGEPPTLVRFEHTFFNADGSRKTAALVDIPGGMASCSTFENGEASEQKTRINFPADTYAGASVMLALQYAFTGGARTVSFHVFDCAPEPAIAGVHASSVDEGVRWEYYPGELARVEMTAEIGMLGKLVGGLLPHRTAWFDPRNGWSYVGGRIQRYFAKGPQMLLVRKVSENTAH